MTTTHQWHSEQMHGQKAQAQPDQRGQHMRGDARRRRPADARVQNDEERAHGHRKKGKHAREI